ncbi:MAG: nicotinate-nucleotide adenylyltransferase [Desulfosalsimonadaceae bacterium]
MLRAGLFGGTFNPVHMGHLRVAEEVRTAFDLDPVYFIPAKIPPHKTTSGLAGSEERYEMLTRAVASNPGFTVSDVEIRRSGRSYTIDTVESFQKEAGRNTALYLLVGLDAFLEISTWKDYESLLEQIAFIVMSRPAKRGTAPAEPLKVVQERARLHLDAGYRLQPEEKCLLHEQKQPIFIYETTQLDISATRIRELVKDRESIKYLVPEAVEDYIYAKDLFVYDR